jgi:hypothetical protein
LPESVFISSTFEDLVDHRTRVQSALRQAGLIDISMEHFGARDVLPVDECARLVKKESNLFVGIYGHRYGYIPDGHDISISEIEYRSASSIPRFIYIIDKNYAVLPRYIDAGELGIKLAAFKLGLTKRHICQFFKTPEDLAVKVIADISRHRAMRAAPKVGVDLPKLEDIRIDSMHLAPEESADDWNKRRNSVYSSNRNLFIAHLLSPSSTKGQLFDIHIYLVRHVSNDFSDVAYADFFMGPHWNNEVFSVTEKDGFIGISTAAFGTFLCICRVHFKDGRHSDLYAYIDFEAQRTGGATI